MRGNKKHQLQLAFAGIPAGLISMSAIVHLIWLLDSDCSSSSPVMRLMIALALIDSYLLAGWLVDRSARTSNLSTFVFRKMANFQIYFSTESISFQREYGHNC